MKNYNKKKGFTIVELVIVVAVVGILTAVLVPTFVKNLNTQLRMKEASNGRVFLLFRAKPRN